MSFDLIADKGYLFLGSRLKRLAEQIQSDVNRVSERAGLTIPPGKTPLLEMLADHGPQSVTDLARSLGLSQPVTTRSVAELIELGLVRVDRADTDGRRRMVSLTSLGGRSINHARELVWPSVEAAVRQLCEELSGTFIEQIGEFEQALKKLSLAKRAASVDTSKTKG